MSPVVPASSPESVLSERHIRILDAAERVFARAGFHAATMQDVAAEAGMSPGNLYRYFSSKDAIIEGMTERDRSLIAEDFGKLCPNNGSLLDQLEALGRKHLVDQPREKAVIAVQIWAEAARNPGMARMCADIESTVIEGLAAAIREAKANGELPPRLDEGRFLMAISMMVSRTSSSSRWMFASFALCVIISSAARRSSLALVMSWLLCVGVIGRLFRRLHAGVQLRSACNEKRGSKQPPIGHGNR